MKNIRMAYIALFAGFMMFASVAFAHHGTANYDTMKSVTVKGSVTDFQFINPHVLIFVDVKDDSGKIQKWQGELTSPNRLTRVGWTKSSIKPGDVITLSGYPTKSGSLEIWIQKVVLGSGEELATGGGN
jgi:lysyl-tRNA synthetase class II